MSWFSADYTVGRGFVTLTKPTGVGGLQSWVGPSWCLRPSAGDRARMTTVSVQVNTSGFQHRYLVSGLGYDGHCVFMTQGGF